MKLALYLFPFFGFLVILIAIVAIVTAQNPTPIALQFLNWRSVSIPFGFFLLFSFLLGLLTALAGWSVRNSQP